MKTKFWTEKKRKEALKEYEYFLSYADPASDLGVWQKLQEKTKERNKKIRRN